MEAQDPDERVADLERQLTQARAAAHRAHQHQAHQRQAHQHRTQPQQPDNSLTPPPRRVPGVFLLAELLPFRWWYVWTLFMVATAPIALWIPLPKAFTLAAVLVLGGIYGIQLRTMLTRVRLLRWGQVATVAKSETLSQGTYYSGTTYSNSYLPVAHGWTVARNRWSGPSTKTHVRYTLDGQQGELVVRGREYTDGVILADQRDPARALCVTSFAYDLNRDETGNWVGALRPRLVVGMVSWLLIVIGWLGLATVTATV